MVTPARLSWGKIALSGLPAGLLGAILMEAYLWLTILRPGGLTLADGWRTVATQALGKGVAHDPNAAAYGVIVILVVSLVWAYAYAYLAGTQPFMSRRWLLSGLAYGIIVYIFMQIVLLVSGNFEYPHTPNDFVNAVIAHAVFFGLPVAYVVSALGRT